MAVAEVVVRVLYRGEAVIAGKENRPQCGEHVYRSRSSPVRMSGHVGRILRVTYF